MTSPKPARKGPQDRRRATNPLFRDGRGQDGPYECATCRTVWATLTDFDNHRKEHR